MIIAVCGGRKFADRDFVRRELQAIHEAEEPIEVLAAGGAPGVDTFAIQWALKTPNVFAVVVPYPTWADRSGGPRRNRVMLEVVRPELLIAFPGGSGTESCIELARVLGIPHKRIRQADETTDA